MTRQLFFRSIAVVALLSAGYVFTAPQIAAETPLSVGSARITISGTSNVHAYTAATTSARVTSVQVAPSVVGATFWDEIVKPGGLQAFEIAIPAARLASDKEGLDKNMHKALKVDKFPEITFRLNRFDPRGKAYRAIGTLKIAGVEREVAFDVTALRQEAGLTVKGSVDMLMTDYGIAPPKAMLGMLKTDPKVTVTFETTFIVPTT
jgi:polyisoprenoid-binding protein YceI